MNFHGPCREHIPIARDRIIMTLFGATGQGMWVTFNHCIVEKYAQLVQLSMQYHCLGERGSDDVCLMNSVVLVLLFININIKTRQDNMGICNSCNFRL